MSTTIGEQLRTKLREAPHQDTTVGVSGDGGSVAVDVEACERYGVGVRGVSVKPDAPVTDIGRVAERIVEKVDVIDPLRVVECDPGQGEAILRSTEPQSDEGGVTYWEAAVKPDETTLHRYHKSHTEPDRTVEVEPLSYSDVGKLADQIVDALGDER